MALSHQTVSCCKDTSEMSVDCIAMVLEWFLCGQWFEVSLRTAYSNDLKCLCGLHSNGGSPKPPFARWASEGKIPPSLPYDMYGIGLELHLRAPWINPADRKPFIPSQLSQATSTLSIGRRFFFLCSSPGTGNISIQICPTITLKDRSHHRVEDVEGIWIPSFAAEYLWIWRLVKEYSTDCEWLWWHGPVTPKQLNKKIFWQCRFVQWMTSMAFVSYLSHRFIYFRLEHPWLLWPMRQHDNPHAPISALIF